MNTITLPAKTLRAALKATGIAAGNRYTDHTTGYMVTEVVDGELQFSKFNYETHVTFTPDPVADGVVLPSAPLLVHWESLNRVLRATIGMRANPDVTLTERPAGVADDRNGIRATPAFLTFEASGYHVVISQTHEPNTVLEAVGDFTDKLEGYRYEVTAPELRRSVAVAKACASKDDMLPILCAVNMFALPDGLKMLATDRYRLSRSMLSTPRIGKPRKGKSFPEHATVKVATLDKASSILAGAVTLTFGDGMFEMADANTRVQTLLTDGDYPKIDSLFPTNGFSVKAWIPRAELLQAAGVALKLAERNTPIVLEKKSLWIRPSFSPGGLYGEKEGYSSTPEITVLDCEGEDFTVAYNPQYLRETLAAIDGDAVNLQITNVAKPSLFTGKPVDGFVAEFLVMPVRLPVLSAS